MTSQPDADCDLANCNDPTGRGGTSLCRIASPQRRNKHEAEAHDKREENSIRGCIPPPWLTVYVK